MNKKWRYYGLKVIEYYSYTQEERNNPDLGLKSEHTLLIFNLVFNTIVPLVPGT